MTSRRNIYGQGVEESVIDDPVSKVFYGRFEELPGRVDFLRNTS